MTPEDEVQLKNTLTNLVVRSLAVRDVVVCLLAAAERSNDTSKSILEEVSEGLDLRFTAIPDQQFALKERIRSEVDWIVSTARIALGDGAA